MWQVTTREKKLGLELLRQPIPSSASQPKYSKVAQAAQRQMCCSCSSCSCHAEDGQLAQKAKQELGMVLAKLSIAVQVLVQDLTLRQV